MMQPAPRTILVIDDQDDERTIQRAILEHQGYRVRVAADGASGIAAALEETPDLILLDVAMPRMDGFEVCTTLRGREQTARVPILLFTASVVGDLNDLAREAGADGVLAKPLDPRRVAEEVARLIARRQEEPR
jgi:CheY-like chemotaxis protein